MLPPFIIEQIRQREERERLRREGNRPHLQLPIEPVPKKKNEQPADEESERGVVIVDLMG
jgi:hypothetical protein